MEDSSDILGGQLHVANHGAGQTWFNLASGQLFSYTVMITLLATAALFSRSYYIRRQENKYNNTSRRRHGIPDKDRRPFNVALAAATVPRPKREGKEREHLSANGSAQVSQGSGAALQRHIPRQRQDTSVLSKTQQGVDQAADVPSRGSSHVDSRRTSGHTVTASESNYHPIGESGSAPMDAVPSRVQSSSRVPVTSAELPRPEPQAARSKHSLDDDDEESGKGKESKKTRVEGDELIDGDEDAGWHESDFDMDVDEASLPQVVRGSKRMADADEDEGFESGRAIRTDKRARKVSRGNDRDSERSSHVSSLGGTRGKKRDRAEAGAGHGGTHVEEEDDGRERAHRRRRVVSNNKKTGNGRGQKRGREVVSTESDDEDISESPSRRAVRHKRGKRVLEKGDTTDEDDGLVSTDPLCAGRRIGEKWESGGVHYKVGPNGQRLREALIRKSRSRFPMPKDSEHPDRDVNMDVFVEVWLTEEQYQKAKEHQDLAWPESTSTRMTLSELGSRSEVPDSPSHGKRLLWSSSSSSSLVPLNRTSKQSTAPTSNMRVNPNGGPIRRISAVGNVTPVVLDSPKLLPSKSYSKWEKQDLEAAALARLRERAARGAAPEPEKKQIGQPLKAAPTLVLDNATAKATTESKPAPPPATATPIISASAPPVAPISFTFDKQPSSITPAPATKASTSDLPSLTIPTTLPKAPEPTKPSTVPFPSFAQPSQQPAEQKSTAPAPASSGLFSFNKTAETKPAETPSAAPPASSKSVPNFFTKPSAPAASSASAATPFNPFSGASAQPTTTTSSQPASNTFSFGPSKAPATQPANTTFSFGPPPTTSSQPAISAFSFGPSTTPAAKAEDKPAQPAASSSLLNRIGGFSAPSQPTSAPAAPAPASASPFWPKPEAPAAPAPAAAAAPTGPAPLKFSFGPTPAAAPAPAPAAAPAVAKPAMTFSFVPSTTTPSATEKPFSFAPSAPPATTPAASSNAGPGAGAFSFNLTNNNTKPSPFGAPSSTSQNVLGSTGNVFGAGGSAQSAQSGSAAPKTAFSFGNASTPTPSAASSNPFGAVSTTPAGPPSSSAFGMQGSNTAPMSFGNVSSTPAATSATPTFGMTGATSAFGSNAGPFGSTTPLSKPPASIFGSTAPSGIFGQGTTTPVGTPTQAKDATKSTFSFGGSTTPAGPPPGTQPPKFSFGISSNPAPANTTNNSQPNPSNFGFGAPTTFTFGKPANADTAQK
ncbi:hypothetical protein BDW22DRAFT_1480801 [Trametopsis cervina]|nr:hypothetical protein BDW22DRAFT_1480801 [Trametopsis cervina]